MTTHTLNLRSIVYFVVLFFSLAAVQVPAHAALIGTDSLVSQAELQQQRDALAEQLLRDDVKKELLTLGVDPADVTERVNGMIQRELQQVQGQTARLL